MKNRKIVKNWKTKKLYFVNGFYEDLYLCYELLGYINCDPDEDNKPNVITNIIKQFFFNKEDIRYLNKKERYLLNRGDSLYNYRYYEFIEEFENNYWEEDTYGGRKFILEKIENEWCKLKEY